MRRTFLPAKTARGVANVGASFDLSSMLPERGGYDITPPPPGVNAAKRCSGQRNDGAPCPGPRWRDNLCWNHHPENR